MEIRYQVSKNIKYFKVKMIKLIAEQFVTNPELSKEKKKKIIHRKKELAKFYNKFMIQNDDIGGNYARKTVSDDKDDEDEDY